MKKHLLFLFAAFATLAASAQTKVEIEGIWYNLISKVKLAEVTSSDGTKYSGSITIPTTVTYDDVAYSVTSIGDEAFFYCSSLTAITIPESVTSIGECAFYECSSLKSITIPEGVTSIEAWAFYGCSRLTDINIPESVTSIGEGAFGDCSSLTSIVVEEGNTIYDSRDGCNAIIETASNVLILGCSATIIPESVTSIGNNAFRGCSSLTAITLPEVVTSIGNNAFSGCTSLTTINIPKGVTSIGESAFYECSSLKSITLPEGVTRIGYSAFMGCSGLTDINIPESVTSIESQAFYYCSSLTAITIPESVTSIGYSAFSGCSSLTAINIPEGVTSIGWSAFRGCSSLTAITLPESVTSIGDEAFYNCSSLTAINIPENSQLTSIGERAFQSCRSLTAITIPEGVTSIGDEAFTGCSSLNTIVLPKSVGYISSKAFAGCPELSDVYCYAETVPGTEADAFDGSYIEYATLHVPASAMNDYKTTAPWSSFGKFEVFEIIVEDIILNKTEAILTEGEEMTLTATVEPDDATDTSVTWSSSNPSVATVDNTGKITAIAPGTATITATANDGSGVSASCEVTVQELILGKCATPTISYVNGKVMLTCETEEATIVSVTNETTEYAAGECEETEFDLIPTYTITAYATKEKYEDSDVATLTLCWVPCEEDHEEDNGILTIPAKPVLISTQGGTITVSGLAEGTEVAVVTTGGTAVATATATNGTATIATSLNAGTTAIVKIGDHSVKVVIK